MSDARQEKYERTNQRRFEAGNRMANLLHNLSLDGRFTATEKEQMQRLVQDWDGKN